MSGVILVLAACASYNQRKVFEEPESVGELKTISFTCPDGKQMKATTHENSTKLELEVPEGVFQLREEETSSGRRFAAEGIVFWMQQRSAIFEYKNRVFRQCERVDS